MNMKISMLWVVTPCSLVWRYQRFGGPHNFKIDKGEEARDVGKGGQETELWACQWETIAPEGAELKIWGGGKVSEQLPRIKIGWYIVPRGVTSSQCVYPSCPSKGQSWRRGNERVQVSQLQLAECAWTCHQAMRIYICVWHNFRGGGWSRSSHWEHYFVLLYCIRNYGIQSWPCPSYLKEYFQLFLSLQIISPYLAFRQIFHPHLFRCSTPEWFPSLLSLYL